MAQSIDYVVSNAIAAKWDATGALTSGSPGGLHRDTVKAPVDASEQTTPYTVYTVKKGKKQNVLTTGAIAVDYRLVTFFVYGDPTAADAVVKALRDTFHAASLSNGGYTALSVLESQEDLGRLLAQRRDGVMQWQGVWVCEVCSQI